MNDILENNKNEVVPVTIFTGFLGSGKTTLINYLLEDVGHKRKLAIVKNEIGDVAVDSKIIRGDNIIMKELLNGCVCCTLVGELEDSLKELVEKVKPDNILIEASGAANPAILAVNIDRLDFVERDMIVTVIDVLHFEGYKEQSVVVRLQEKFTDLIVLNRVNQVDEMTIEDVLDDVYDAKPGVRVVKTATGRVDPEIIFGASGKNPSVKILDDNDHKHTHDHDLHGEHIHEDEIQSFSYRRKGVMSQECVQKVLENLTNEFYRIKGFINVVVDGQNQSNEDHKIIVVNYVCGRINFEDRPVVNRDSKENEIAFIGKRVGKYEEKITAKLDDCLNNL